MQCCINIILKYIDIKNANKNTFDLKISTAAVKNSYMNSL